MDHHKVGHEEICAEHLFMDANFHQDEGMTLLCFVWVNKQQIPEKFLSIYIHGLCQYLQNTKPAYSHT